MTLALIIFFALAFDFTNGFHDTANSIATMVGTRAVPPKIAVFIASAFNFIGAFASLKVAATVGKGIVAAGFVTPNVILAGLVGAIAWNLVTWKIGIPSSSSHALFGGLIGSAFAANGTHAVEWGGIRDKIVIPAVESPAIGFLAALVVMALLMRIFHHVNPTAGNKGFRYAQVVSGSWLSFTHGTNDAQKTMGIMALALAVHNGTAAADFHVPMWVVISAASSMAIGTYTGGWSIIKTLGGKIVKMDPMQGFSASIVSAGVLYVAAKQGIPVSTTHVVSGSVMGAGASKRASSVRWSVAIDIVTAWVLTLPISAVVGGAAYELARISPAVLVIVAIGIVGWLYYGRGTKGSAGAPIAAR